jgi:predicted component of type VI protein secretion system
MIKIEVTGNSIPEVADKLLAIGASLRASVAVETPRGATKEEASAGNAPQKSNTSKSVPPAEVTESQQTTTAPSSTPAPAASVSEELEVVDLPIAAPEVNLRDLVLSVVEKRGKPVMEEILSRFGVPKASMVGPERLPELIALCNEALSK